jgi:uncharacterized DUF497 family protein
LKFNFEWDPSKAKDNFRKHKLAFEHTAEIFLDPLTLSVYDEEHSSQEDRATKKEGKQYEGDNS